MFSVNIGLCRLKDPVLGVVYIPCSISPTPPRVYYSVQGCGAFVKNVASCPTSEVLICEEISPRRLKTSLCDEDEHLTVITSCTRLRLDTIAVFCQMEDPLVIRKSGNALMNILLIAEGEANAYLMLTPTCEWHTCAYHAIINESGGELLQLTGESNECSGLNVEYNKLCSMNPYFMVHGRRQVPTTCVDFDFKKQMSSFNDSIVEVGSRRNNLMFMFSVLFVVAAMYITITLLGDKT
jgi:3'(2'), 5'-bisphosphate nucleotidase